MTQECTAACLTPPALNISPDFQKFGFEDNWGGGGPPLINQYIGLCIYGFYFKFFKSMKLYTESLYIVMSHVALFTYSIFR